MMETTSSKLLELFRQSLTLQQQLHQVKKQVSNVSYNIQGYSDNVEMPEDSGKQFVLQLDPLDSGISHHLIRIFL